MTATNKISLLKAQSDKVKISLEKRQVLTAPIVRVGEALDISGSMNHAYQNGDVSKIVFRTLALANIFDDNGEMDMWAFNTDVTQLESATPNNFDQFVNDEVIHGVGIGGGTRYSPCLEAISEFYFPAHPATTSATSATSAVSAPKKGFLSKLFGKSAPESQVVVPILKGTPQAAVANVDPATIPALAIFITDGENDINDVSAAERVLKNAQNKEIYWLLVGIGHSNFTWLEKMADKYPNVGFLSFEHLDMSDEELYDGVISEEFVNWIKK
jgi:hypothetical protein